MRVGSPCCPVESAWSCVVGMVLRGRPGPAWSARSCVVGPVLRGRPDPLRHSGRSTVTPHSKRFWISASRAQHAVLWAPRRRIAVRSGQRGAGHVDAAFGHRASSGHDGAGHEKGGHDVWGERRGDTSSASDRSPGAGAGSEGAACPHAAARSHWPTPGGPARVAAPAICRRCSRTTPAGGGTGPLHGTAGLHLRHRLPTQRCAHRTDEPERHHCEPSRRHVVLPSDEPGKVDDGARDHGPSGP